MTVTLPVEQKTTKFRNTWAHGIADHDDDRFDVTIRKLILQIDPKASLKGPDVTNLISIADVEETMAGASQFTLDILDRDLLALKSGMFGQKVDVTIDGVPFRVTEVGPTDVDQLQLLFEHRIVAKAREHSSPLKVTRDSHTRAEFIYMMFREITDEVITFVSPELHKVQPIAGGATQPVSSVTTPLVSVTSGKRASTLSRQSGFSSGSMTIHQWDGGALVLGPTELANMKAVLDVCAQVNAPAKAVLAVVEACIVEDSCRNSSVATDGTSIGIFQVTDGTAAQVPGGNRLDVAATTKGFLLNGYWKYGSAISIANSNPGISAGTVAQRTQGSAFGSRYDLVQGSAEQIIRAYTGGSLAGFAGSSLISSGALNTQVQQYEFSRGYSGQKEDTWTCGQRLASEVGWRLFVAGKHNVYYVQDSDLMATGPRYLIDPQTTGVVKVTYRVQTGGRTIVRKGVRQPMPSTAQMEVRIDRWDAPPGTVIELADYGPADGRWLVESIKRSMFDAQGTVQLVQPQAALAEPAPTTTTAGGAGGLGNPNSSAALSLVTGGGIVQRVYAAAQQITARHLPYVYGGGHGSWGGAAAASGGGLDCSSSVSLALHMAGLMNNYSGPITSGEFSGWGVPGEGTTMTIWYSGSHVFIQFYGFPAQRFDTVGGGGPQLRFTPPPESGMSPRHWPGE